MYNFSYHILVICLFIVSKSAFSIPTSILEKRNQKEESPSHTIIPNSDVVEENSEPVFIMVPLLGERSRRGIYEDAKTMNFDNLTYEVPTFLRLNDSSRGDFKMSLVPGTETRPRQIGGGGAIGTGMGGPNSNCCPSQPSDPKPNWSPSRNEGGVPPLCLTISIDNAFPPAKVGKIDVTNSSDIRGTNVLLKINFVETKTSTSSHGINGDFECSNNKEKLESQKDKKVDEDDEDEGATKQTIDQKTLQEIILRILTGNKNIKSKRPTEDLIFLENSTGNPSFSFVFNPSHFHKITGKYPIPATRSSTTYKGLNPPDFDILLKTVEHITSGIPREKLLTLLSNLINKATLNEETSSNQ